MSAISKVGILPYRRIAGDELEFLIHLPKAKNPHEQNQLIWGLARGTVELSDDSLQAAALREAGEELGLDDTTLIMDSLVSHGTLTYHSQSKPPYPIVWFSVETAKAELETLRARAPDAHDIAWKTRAAIEEMAATRQFKPGYLSILDQLASALRASDK